MGACLGCQRQSDQEKEGQQVVSKKGDLEHAARTEADQLRSEQGSGDWKGVDTVAKGTANADIHDEELSTEAEVKEVRALIHTCTMYMRMLELSPVRARGFSSVCS